MYSKTNTRTISTKILKYPPKVQYLYDLALIKSGVFPVF